MSTATELDKWLDTLRQQRDELHLQMHLAKADARDEWDKLEVKWTELQGKLGKAHGIAGETMDEARAATDMLVDEIKRGYERLRKLF